MSLNIAKCTHKIYKIAVTTGTWVIAAVIPKYLLQVSEFF